MRPDHASKNMHGRLVISVVIPVYNEQEAIGACLDHIVAQERPFDEVIVVDNNSTDDSVEVAARYSDRLPLRIISESRQGCGPARDAGFGAARADIIGKIDADSRLEPDWTTVLEQFALEHPEASMVGGPHVPYDLPDAPALMQKRRSQIAARPTARRLDRALIPVGGPNYAVRPEAWRAALPHVKHAPGTHEDVDLIYSIRKSGGQVWELPTMIAGVSLRRELGYTPRTAFRYAMATVRSHRVHGGYAGAAQLMLLMPLFHTYWISAQMKYGTYDAELEAYVGKRRWGRKKERHSAIQE